MCLLERYCTTLPVLLNGTVASDLWAGLATLTSSCYTFTVNLGNRALSEPICNGVWQGANITLECRWIVSLTGSYSLTKVH